MKSWPFNLHAIRAVAVFLSFFAAVLPAEAKVVYTPVGVTVSGTGSLKIDLNHDGKTDFTIWALTTGQACGITGGEIIRMVTAMPTKGNGVAAVNGDAIALNPGIHVQSQSFAKAQTLMSQSVTSRGCGPSSSQGNWLNVANRYLGLVFQINGQTHYGWAELSVNTPRFSFTGTLSVTLTGFAYETMAGHAINTGQISGSADDPIASDSTNQKNSNPAPVANAF